MRIESLKPFLFVNKQYKNNNHINFKGQEQPPTDNNIWQKLNRFTVDEYKKLSTDEVAYINDRLTSLISPSELFIIGEDVNYHDIITNGIKNTLDKDYGRGHYFFIPIGRSLSSIGKCLGYKIGEQYIKPFPFSNGMRFEYFDDITECSESLEDLSKYLASIGLTKDAIHNTENRYVISDYTYSGSSLRQVERLLKTNNVFGMENNIVFKSISKLLEKGIIPDISNYYIKDSCAAYDFRMRVDRMLNEFKFKQYSFVNRCTNLSNISQAIISPQYYSDKVKCFLFKFLSKIVK